MIAFGWDANVNWGACRSSLAKFVRPEIDSPAESPFRARSFPAWSTVAWFCRAGRDCSRCCTCTPGICRSGSSSRAGRRLRARSDPADPVLPASPLSCGYRFLLLGLRRCGRSDLRRPRRRTVRCRSFVVRDSFAASLFIMSRCAALAWLGTTRPLRNTSAGTQRRRGQADGTLAYGRPDRLIQRVCGGSSCA